MAMKEQRVSADIGFRACELFLDRLSNALASENLEILAGEMAAIGGRRSWDPALEYAWNDLWGTASDRSVAEAARIAAEFIKREGDWGYEEAWAARLESLFRVLTGAEQDVDNAVWSTWVRSIDDVLAMREAGK